MAYEDPIEKLLNLLRSEFTGNPFKSFYDGDPGVIPEANLPAIVVEKNDDDTRGGPTGKDRVEEEITIKVVYNQKDDWSNNDPNTDLTRRKIRKIVEERDDNGTWLPHTIKGLLRRNLTMQGVTINTHMRFELGVVPRTDDLVTAEGHLSIVATYEVPVARSS